MGAVNSTPSLVTKAAYARHRGVSKAAVTQAIKGNRLVRALVTVDGKALLDVAIADAEWAANTDLSKAPDAVKEKAGLTTGQARVSALSEASTREKNARAGLVELEYQEKAGQLVSAAAVQSEVAAMVSRAREAMLAVPSKCKGLIPHLTPAEVHQIHELVCKALDQVAEAGRQRRGAA